MKNSDYKKLTNILRSLSQTAPLSSEPDYYIPTKQLVSAARDLAAIAVDDIAAESLNQHQYTDDLVKAIKEFRSVQDAFSDSCRILFKKELWPILDNICPPEAYGDPWTIKHIIESDAYKIALESGRLTRSFEWTGTISELVRWLAEENSYLRDPKPGCLDTENRWRDVNLVFTIKGKRITARQLKDIASKGNADSGPISIK